MKELGQGLNGWLDANGTFHECEYGKHSEFAAKMNVKGAVLQDNNWINFSSKKFELGGSDHCVAGIYSEPTEEQIEWLKNNMGKLDKQQVEDIKDAFSFYKVIGD
ncbi:hypothetical protein [Neobacillus vireti]|uniref:Uncharacterized protein n=1 Tax=Neobacillus vireti LMG 21834 TaxID=1131730 RepID=A0AB94IJJ4_9BACI|nr:hypothetical protein [Neobacillus vireti]ETI67271.1 hypothetical protein BAVI_18517 [Neobacillus vireti LMG 21834]KLT19662.1 hypothetical protein AA980_03485 [Neobacillus vireti]